MKVLFAAAPLTARTGVYRSAQELVAAGRSVRHDWSLALGVSTKASGGAADTAGREWFKEVALEPSGLSGVAKIRRWLKDLVAEGDIDLVVSLVPQTDMALAGTRIPWISFVRGLPWPEKGESSMVRRIVWSVLERMALRRAQEVWATTEVLRNQLTISREVSIVPAGIAPIARTWDGSGARRTLVWAARFDEDKRPRLFVDILRGTPSLDGVMFGSGHLIDEIRNVVPANVAVAGWASPDQLWNGALAYLGTSSREAFGRSAVEAAMNGVPVILDHRYGCAPQLVTDPEFAMRFLLRSDDAREWGQAAEVLAQDEGLRVAYSQHLVENAGKLTIQSSAEAVHERISQGVAAGN